MIATVLLYAQEPRAAASGPDAPYLDLLRDVDPRPLFIVGPHRSGTTLLSTLLAGTGRFSFPSVYSVLHRHELLRHHVHREEARAARDALQQAFASRGIKDRVYDSLPAAPDLFEEYAYVLEHRGRRPRLSDRNVGALRLFMKKLAFTQDPSRPLLLKNPYDADNFLYLRRAFPSAAFVFIHRNPVQVIDSQLRMFHLMLDPGNQLELIVNRELRRLFDHPLLLAACRRIYNERSPVLFWQALYYLLRCDDYIADNADALGASAFMLTYDELCREPAAAIGRVLRFIGAPEVPEYDPVDRIRVRLRPLLPLVERHRQSVERRTRRFCIKFGV